MWITKLGNVSREKYISETKTKKMEQERIKHLTKMLQKEIDMIEWKNIVRERQELEHDIELELERIKYWTQELLQSIKQHKNGQSNS